MNNQNEKSTWALCLSIAAIVLCVLVFLLWIFEVVPHSVILPESFIGACIALLGVTVTVAVGAQIVNVMEVKSAQRRYEADLKVALEKIQLQQEQIELSKHVNTHLHNCTFAVVMELNRDYARACYYYLSALYEGLQTKNAEGNVEFAFYHWKKCLEDGKPISFSVPLKMKEEIKSIDMLIQKQSNFPWIKSQYEPLRDEYFKRVGL